MMHIIRSLNVVLTFVCSCFHMWMLIITMEEAANGEEEEEKKTVKEQRPEYCLLPPAHLISRGHEPIAHIIHIYELLMHGAPQMAFFVCKEERMRVKERTNERKYKKKHESDRCHAIVHRQIMLHNTK